MDQEKIRVERINGQDIRVGTLEEFAAALHLKLERDEAGQLKRPNSPRLDVIKFHQYGQKNYRLIWIFGRSYWLAAEHLRPYGTRVQARAAGVELAARKGAQFSEVSR